MADTKDLPPSEIKLRRLRAEGKLPISKLTIQVGALLGTSLAVINYWQSVAESLSARLKQCLDLEYFLFTANTQSSPYNALRLFSQDLFYPLFIQLFCLTSLLLISGLTQAKFYFNPGLCWRGVEKLGFKNPLVGNIRRASTAIARCVFGAICLVIFVFLVAGDLRGINDSVFNSIAIGSAGSSTPGARGYGLPISFSTLTTILADTSVIMAMALFKTFIGLSILFGVLSWMANLLDYRYVHGMSRSEYESELRESEGSDVMRGRQREFSVEDF